MKKPTSVKQILNSHTPELQELLQHSRQINKLNTQLHRLLPPPLSLHCTAAGVAQHTLTILVDSPAWGTRLRLQAPNLIKAFADFQIKSVAIKVQQPHYTPENSPRARPKMSQETSSLLSHMAEATRDQKLKLALQRLARNVSK